jgi:uncharacterized protein
MRHVLALFDRTLVLFLGIAAGMAIGYAFADRVDEEAARVLPDAPPIEQAPPVIAPPPPAAPVADEPVATKPMPAPPPATIQPPGPDLPSPQMLSTIRGGNTIRVGVFGDSFGDGVWTALYRLLPAKDGFRVVKYSQQSTGFTRYRRLNLLAHDEEQIGADPLDVAVIAFGANDAQGVCDAGKCGALMSPLWQQVIGRRVADYVSMLRRHGAAVYWVGLPVMRDAAFDHDAQAMDAFYRRTMRDLGVPFIDIRPLTTDGEGHYQAYYRDGDGAPRLVRAGDGVHMSMNGYIRVTKALAARIKATVAAANSGGHQAAAENAS